MPKKNIATGFFRQKIFSEYFIWGVLGLFFVIGFLFLSTGIAGDLLKAATTDPYTPVFNGGGIEEGAKKVQDNVEGTGIIAEGDVTSTVIKIVNYLLGFIGLILTIIVIYAGLKLIFSGGDDEELGNTKKILLYALLGVVIIILSYKIVQLMTLRDPGVGDGVTQESSTGGNGNSDSSGGNDDASDALDALKKDLDELKKDKYLDEFEIEALKEKLAELMEKVPDTELFQKKYEELLRDLEALSKDRDNKELIEKIKKSLEESANAISKLPEVKARISYKYSSKQVPAVISLSGEKTYIKGDSSLQIKNNDYSWSVVNPDGIKTEIGTGITREYTIEKSGNYIFFLEAILTDAEGKQTSLQGNSHISFFAEPTKTEVSFLANTQKSGGQIEFSLEENENEIIFSPVIIPQKGREIHKYIWKFGDIRIEKDSNVDVPFSFKQEGKYRVTLTAVDNAGESTTESNYVTIIAPSTDTTQQEVSTEEGSLDTSTKIEEVTVDLEALKAKDVLTVVDVEAIRRSVTDIYEQFPHNDEVVAKYQAIMNLLNQLADDLENEELFTSVDTKVKEFFALQDNFYEVKARISHEYSAKTVPMILSLSGAKSYVKGTSSVQIKNNDYLWTGVNPKGEEFVIGRGISREYEITDPGQYVFFLRVVLSDDDGKQISIAGNESISFFAQPQGTQVSFLANDKSSGEIIEFTKDENEQKILFTPQVEVEKGREIVSYKWKFDGRLLEEKEGKSVLYSFDTPGKHTVSLTVIDNNKKSVTAQNFVFIQDLVAYFSLKNRGTYEIGEKIYFSGKRSKSINGLIHNFTWKFFDENNTEVFTSEDESFEKAFDVPGRYSVVLTVSDSNGLESSYSSHFTVSAQSPHAYFTFDFLKDGYPATLTFNAAKSYDPVSSSLLYSWDFDGDGVFEKEDESSPITEYTFDEAGQYKVALRVKNEYGKTKTFTKNVSIRSTLTGEILVDPFVENVNTPLEFSVLTNKGTAFEWNFGDGRREIIEEKKIEHSFDEDGRYRVYVTITETETGEKIKVFRDVFIGAVDTPIAVANVSVNGKELLPSDVCGANTYGYKVSRTDSLKFSGKNSVNRDGTSQSLKYRWIFPGEVLSSKANINWKFAETSEKSSCYKVFFQVQDVVTDKKSSPFEIYFLVENALPEISSFSVKKPRVNISPVSIPLAISAKDSDGKIIKYSWWATQEGGNGKKIGFHSSSENKTVLVIPRVGKEGDVYKYTFHAQVEDNSGGVVTTDDELGQSVEIELETSVDTSPRVKIVQDKKVIKMGDTVVFTAEAESESGEDLSDVATFKWDFDGDNIFDDVESGATVEHKYTRFGKFVPRLKVVYKGLSTSVEGKVEVEETSKLPLAAFTYKKGKEGEVQFSTAHAKYDETVQGNALSYAWDKNLSEDSDGDGESKNDVDSTEKNPIFIYDKELRSVTVQLTVSDSVGGKDVLSQKIVFDKISGVLRSQSYEDEEGGEGEEGEEGDSSWSSVLDSLGKEINASVRMVTNISMTTLDLYGGESIVSQGEQIEVFAFTSNVDGTLYDGPLNFSVTKGAGNFSDTTVQSVQGRANTVFTPESIGTVVINATATETLLGEVSENLVFEVISSE
jgi:hypothetical protein